MYYMLESYELALVLVGKDPQNDADFDDDDGEVDSLLYEKYGIEDGDKFDRLCRDLLDMIDVGSDPLTGNMYKGFSVPGSSYWLMNKKVEGAKNDQPA